MLLIFRTSSPVAGWAFPDFDFGLDPPWSLGPTRDALHLELAQKSQMECRWTLVVTQPANLEPGLSGTEVALAIVLEHGAWLPVRRQMESAGWFSRCYKEISLISRQTWQNGLRQLMLWRCLV